MNILVPMAGSDIAFKEKGYDYPKNFVELIGKPLLQHVYENLRSKIDGKYIFVVKKEEVTRYHLDSILHIMDPHCQVIILEDNAAGAACTALLAIEEINNNEPLIIANGDQIILADLKSALASFRQSNMDGGIITFNSLHPRWSYVRINEEGLVIEAAEKRPISNYATAGFYYFKHGKCFVDAAMSMIRKDAAIDGKFYVCPTFNEMILNQAKIGIFDIKRDKYFSFSNPEGVRSYEIYLKKQEEVRT